MQINLNNDDLIQAIQESVARRFAGLPDEEMVITIKATRNPSGYTAAVEFVKPSDQVSSEPEPPFAADSNTGTEEDQPALDLDND